MRLERLQTPIGEALLVTDEEGALVVLDWADRRDRFDALVARSLGAIARAPDPPAPRSGASLAVGAYFEGAIDALDAVPVRLVGTDFQRAVWHGLRAISAGETETYGGLAARLGRPDAVRAVGAANGANPISVVLPCHRVIGADGSLVGYAGGLDRKRWLLRHEGRAEAPTQGRLFT